MNQYQKHVQKLVRILLISADNAWGHSAMQLNDLQQYEINLHWAKTDDEAVCMLQTERFEVLLLDCTFPKDIFRYARMAYAVDTKCRFVMLAETIDLALANRMLSIGAVCIMSKQSFLEQSLEEQIQCMLTFHDQYCLNLFYNYLPPYSMQPPLMHAELENGKYISGLTDQMPEWLRAVKSYHLAVLRYVPICTPLTVENVKITNDNRKQDGHITLYGRILHDILSELPQSMLMYVGSESMGIIFYQFHSDSSMPDVHGAMRYISSALMLRYATPSRWKLSEVMHQPEELPKLFQKMHDVSVMTSSEDEETLYWDLTAETEVQRIVARGDADALANFFELQIAHLTQESNYEQAIQLFISGALRYASRLLMRHGVVDCTEVVDPQQIDLYDVNLVSNWLTNIYAFLIECIKKEECIGKNRLSPFIRHALTYINEHYDNSYLRITDVGKVCRVSSFYLSRTFTKETGFTFISYLNHLRIFHATELIRQESGSIQQIAERVGFNNYNIFFAYFKRIVGVTPKDYRRAPFDMAFDPIFYNVKEDNES